jgi:hypothetical protein
MSRTSTTLLLCGLKTNPALPGTMDAAGHLPLDMAVFEAVFGDV